MKISPSALLILAFLFPFILLLLNKLLKKRARTGTSIAVETQNSEEVPSSRSSKVGWDHEVFLSFRGPDTRNTFTDCLYFGLKDAGIEAFIDSEDLHIGERIGPKLIEAIKHSKISIPIFSSDFASSHWCLREVAAMVECMTNEGQFIFPIFFDVEPSHVRHQKGSYEEAFRKLNKKFPKEVEGWKKALKEVADLSGLEVKKTFDGREGQIIKMLVLKVLGRLRKKHLIVTDCLVGIDSRVKEIKTLLSVDPGGVRIVGIHGMGGIGKTTTAKVVYNELLTDFSGLDYCSFLADIRETSQQHKGIVSLQNQLLSDILKQKSFDITTVDQGINMIKDKFCNKKVLIVLDDVSERSHLKDLGVKHAWFGSGSRIIITTRDKLVINVPEVDSTYEITELNSSQSLRLFSKHAFGSDFDHPPEEYVSLSEDVVDTASGLPLALESIGSFLFGMGKDKWKATIEKLKNIPPDDVQKKLRISYDGLEKDQQEIFLDIACLFNGVDKRIASYMWDACGFFPEVGIEVLLLRSLVKYGDKNELRMHDHYVGLGRKIVRDESYNNPGERTRLWNYRDALRVLKSRCGTPKVEALCLNLEYEQRGNCFSNEDFAKLLNLRFLEIYDAEITGDFERLFSNLRWLRWKECPENFRVSNFHPEELVILDLSQSMVTEHWEGWRQIKVAKNLKVLDLNRCHYLTKTPDFSSHKLLERLNLEGCISLVEIDPSIGHLKRLVFLNLKHCEKIEELPKEFSSLHALEELFIDGTSLQEVPVSSGRMKKLKTLSARYCKKLTRVPSSIGKIESLLDLTLTKTRIIELPDSIGSLVKLRSLSLGSIKLRTLPGSIGKLESLTKLHLSKAKCTELPDSIGDLKNLRVLILRSCLKIHKLPDSIGNLKNLRVLKIIETGVRKLPNAIGMLEKLEELEVLRCYHLTGEIPNSIGGLTSLKILRLEATKICSIQNICGLPNLQTLELNGCEELPFPPELPSSLKNLIVSYGLETLPNFSVLINLEKLVFSNCFNLVEVPRSIGELSGLSELQILYCSRLEWLPALPSGLFRLVIDFCPFMEGDLSNLENLSELRVNCWSESTEIQGLGKLKLLTALNISNCSELLNLDGLQELVFLRDLNITYCESLETLPNLSKLKMLRVLICSTCNELCEIEGLETLESLEKLSLSHCASLENLANLSNLKMLKELQLECCDKLPEIPGVEELNSLEFLLINRCTSIKRSGDLSNLVMLKELVINACEKLGEIEGLEYLESLEMLNLSHCESLKRLPNISSLKNLKYLYLTNSDKLTEIQGIEELESLKCLDVSGCKALETLPELSNIKEVIR